MAATLTLVPVPEAPRTTPWEHVGQYLEFLRREEADWNQDPPTYETLGRLHRLRADLATDLSYLAEVAKNMDWLLADVVCEVRNAEVRNAEARDGR